MDIKEIERIQKLSSKIDNFKNIYENAELWGVVDGPVPYEKLIAFLIENPHLQQLADEIEELSK